MQGVDISDIEIVVQWRATCNLDTLWQRFGRAARGVGRSGIAIFLVEAKYFDEVKRKATENAQRSMEKSKNQEAAKQTAKRKKGTHDNVANKKARTGSVEEAQASSTVLQSQPGSSNSNGEEGDGELTVFEKLRVEFGYASKKKKKAARVKSYAKEKTKEDEEVDPAIDAVINAGEEAREIGCYRAPIMAFYENDIIGKYFYLLQ